VDSAVPFTKVERAITLIPWENCPVLSLPVKWPTFEYEGESYDLSHLNPCTQKYERPAEGNRPSEVYTVEVVFSLHCFSHGPKPEEAYNAKLVYPNRYETRLFDLRRYEHSKLLPGIIQTLPERKPCHNRNRRNFFLVELIAENGTKIEYEIFFKVKKKSKGLLEMIVESAFVRDADHRSTRPRGKPVRFWIILHNTLNNRDLRI
jgi:hypothetical protein